MALVWLALLVLVAVGVTFAFGTIEAGALRQLEESKAGSSNGLCRPIDLWILGLATIPLIPLVSGDADKCDVTATPQGGAYIAVSILLKVLAWALVALFAVGYSNIVRKPGP